MTRKGENKTDNITIKITGQELEKTQLSQRKVWKIQLIH